MRAAIGPAGALPAPPAGRWGVVRRAAWLALWLAGFLAMGPAAAATPLGELVVIEASGAPPLDLKDIAGRPHRLADYRGRVILVNFWATWCEPCRAEMPSLDQLRAHFSGRPLTILAVNYGESAEKVRAFLGRVPVEFPLLLDPFQESPRAWKATILPVTFVIDREGVPRYRAVGEVDWMGPEVVRRLDALMR